MGRTSTTKERTIDTAERDARAARLRVGGATYEQIAQEIGYANKGTAYKAVQRALREAPREAASELLNLELDRLDTLQRAATAVLSRTHTLVSHGRVVTDDAGNPLLDDGPRLQAIETLRRVSESRRKLLGIDAPAKAQVSIQDGWQQEVERLAAELGAVDADSDASAGVA